MTDEKKEAPITRKVPFKLTDGEVAAKAKAFADLTVEIENIESRAKLNAKQLKAEADRLRGESLLIREQVMSRKEDRVVDCWKAADLSARVWRIHREDTGEVVDSVPMTAEEVAKHRQLEIEEFAALKAAAPETDATATEATA